MRLMIIPFPGIIKSGKAVVHGVTFFAGIFAGMHLILWEKPEFKALYHISGASTTINYNRDHYPGNCLEEDRK